ncbi:MAG: BatA domain-containing protein [Spirosomataceae bacterium]
MEFLNPLMGWGALAVAVPIALHLWHRKKGKLLPWAATQWLSEKDLQPAKGIRLDNVLLLIIRCIVLVSLVFLLAKPILRQDSGSADERKIHLVQANSSVVNNYKFEIEEALKKGESIYWIGTDLQPVEETSMMPTASPLHPLNLQTCINKAAELNRYSGKAKFELYLLNDPMLSQLSEIFVPGKAGIHSVADTTHKPIKPYLELSDKQKVFVNHAGQLTTAPMLPVNEKFENQPRHIGAINVLLKNSNSFEKQAIEAALKALTEVYRLDFSVDEQSDVPKKYDWVFADTPPVGNEKTFTEKTLVFVSENKIPFPEQGKFENRRYYSAETVRNGQLPEWLGERLIQQYELQPKQTPLSQQQLSALFKTEETRHHESKDEGWFSKAVLLGVILLLGIERWLAITKNA